MEFLITLLKALFVIGVAMNVVPLLIYLERKICAYIQGRLGPNRVNFSVGDVRYLLPASLHGIVPEGLARVKLVPGSLQPLADAIKLAFKEEIVPDNVDKLLYNIAPAIGFISAATALAFIPFGGVFEIGPGEVLGLEFGRTVVDLRVATANIGVLGLFAVASLAVYGIAMGGWGSGSKYPLMGAVRSAAQMISYEIALFLALVSAIATVGSVDLQEFVTRQATAWGGFGWLVFKQPLAALIFLVAMFAENNRLPFDLPEAEPELVGGYHTEYTGLKFAVFFLGEYVAMILMCSVFVTVFLGGWSLPGLIDPTSLSPVNALLSVLVFGAKVFLLLCFQLWIRWTLPRFRYDQIMSLGWKMLVPLALVNLVVTAVVLTFWA